MFVVSLVLAACAFAALVSVGRLRLAVLLAGAVLLGGWVAALGLGGIVSPVLFGLLAAGWAAALALLWLPGVRRRLVTRRLLRVFARALPRMSETERIALEAGTVWWDGDLFSGAPDFERLLAVVPQPLSAREQAFLDGPVQELCAMLDDWRIHELGDLPPEVWSLLKRERFFGMIIPEAHGGLGFSAAAHSAVITKLASRSSAATVTVMVPNSIGPAELLLHYGTEAQKAYYLPRLARGEEIPCFALTEPEAGSDAASTQSQGVVCHGLYRGRQVLGMRLDWTKRYITLGPVATVIGLAFKLRDPDRLLGGPVERGITCALVPADLPGIAIGDRHDPLGVPFLNGPNSGHDVFVPLDCIIGGPAMAGQGWRMLMECLAAGRAVSLPSLSSGGAAYVARAVGDYASLREQFGQPIGRFEGIEEPLARIGGATYFMNAARRLTMAALDAGHRPAVVSAMVKLRFTEAFRDVVRDGMDVQGGAAICRGPRNLLAPAFESAPIGITVEGANILTRTLIVYGQGAIRCHPFVREEMAAVAAGDVERFDRALVAHLEVAARNAARSLLLGLTGSRLARAPRPGATAVHFRRLARLSAAFATTSEVAMTVLRGDLKRREKLSGRLADALSYLYLGSAVLWEYVHEGEPRADEALMHWAARHCLSQAEAALAGVVANFPHRVARALLHLLALPRGVAVRPPSDADGAAVARLLLDGNEALHRLTRDIYVPDASDGAFGRLDAALGRVAAMAGARDRVRQAVRRGLLDGAAGSEPWDAAVRAGVITVDERLRLAEAEALRDEVIQVDSFPRDAFGPRERAGAPLDRMPPGRPVPAPAPDAPPTRH